MNPAAATDRTGAHSPHADVSVAIEMARIRVEQTSLREVAKEIGMSPTGLRGVLDGTAFYGKTREKLAAWHLQQRGLVEVPVEVAENTLLALVRALRDQREGALLLLHRVEEVHRLQKVSVPRWVGEVRARLAISRRRS